MKLFLSLLGFFLLVACSKDSSSSLFGKTYIPVSILFENCDDPDFNGSNTFDDQGCTIESGISVCFEYRFTNESSGTFHAISLSGSVRPFDYSIVGDQISICFTDGDMECETGTLTGNRIISTGVDVDGCSYEVILKKD